MLRLRALLLTCCVALIGTLFVHAQDGPDLKAVIRKAIEAHGGEKALNKLQGGSSKFKGTMQIAGLEANVKGESFFQKPDRMKSILNLEIMNKEIVITQVYDGKKFWVSTAGNTMEIKDEKILNEVKESLLVEGAGSFSAFLEKPYELNAVGEVKVKGKDAICIRITKKGQRDFSLFFDKKTFLVVKSEMRAYDAMSGQEVTQEKFVTDYQLKEGLKVAKRVEIHKDGKLFMDIEVTEVQVVEKLDDAIFAKP